MLSSAPSAIGIPMSLRLQTTRKRKSRRRATAAVEFALCAPVALALVFGVFEFARLSMVRQALTNSAREGCRKATLVTTQRTSAVESVIRTRMAGVISHPNDPQRVKIRTTPSNLSTLTSETPITTSIELDYSDVSLLPGWLLGTSKITVVATMERE